MHGVDFFALNCGLEEREPQKGWHEGKCEGCGRKTVVGEFSRALRCNGCSQIFRGFADQSASTGKPYTARLSDGTNALLTEQKAVFWTTVPIMNHVSEDHRHRVEVKVAKGEQKKTIRELVFSPPAPPFLFVSFAKSNDGTTFVVNNDTDTIYISGTFEVRDQPVRSFSRKKVLDLLAAYPDFRPADWDLLIKSRYGMCGDNSAKAAREFNMFLEKEPSLRSVELPYVGSAEHEIIYMISDIGGE